MNKVYDKRTDTAAGTDLPPAHLQEERTGDDVFPRRVEGRGLTQLPALENRISRFHRMLFSLFFSRLI